MSDQNDYELRPIELGGETIDLNNGDHDDLLDPMKFAVGNISTNPDDFIIGDIHDVDTEPAGTYVDLDVQDESEGGSRPKHGGLTRAVAKKVIEKYLELTAAPPKQLQLLAATLGVKADAAELAATIASAQRTNLQAINELASVAESAVGSPFAGVLTAAALSRENAKRVWVILSHLGQVTGALPVKELTAAAKIAEAAAELSAENLADLDAVRQLGRK